MLHIARDFKPVDHTTEIRVILGPVVQACDEWYGSKALMPHEAQLLIEVLARLSFNSERLRETSAFLLQVDPLKRDGLTLEQLAQYVRAAKKEVERPQWLTNALDMIVDVQQEVTRRTGQRLFRTIIVEAGIAFYITGLPPDEVELTRSDSDAQLG